MGLGNAITAAGFWIGTVLPIAYFPVILSGIDSAASLSLFVGILAFHAVALVVGHDYAGRRAR